MLQPTYASIDQRPRATRLRAFGTFLLMAGLTLNVWMLIARAGIGWRLGLMVLMPGAVLLFTAFLVENTPSMRGCLMVFGFMMAFVIGFWAWAGVATALSPTSEPPEMFRQAPSNAPAPDADEDAPANEARPEGGDASQD